MKVVCRSPPNLRTKFQTDTVVFLKTARAQPRFAEQLFGSLFLAPESYGGCWSKIGHCAGSCSRPKLTRTGHGRIGCPVCTELFLTLKQPKITRRVTCKPRARNLRAVLLSRPFHSSSANMNSQFRYELTHYTPRARASHSRVVRGAVGPVPAELNRGRSIFRKQKLQVLVVCPNLHRATIHPVQRA